MFLRLWPAIALAVAGVACGRVGVELVPLDASLTLPPFELDAGREAGTDSIDAAGFDSGGVLDENVVIDAGTSRDAAADAAQDAGSDAAQDAAADAAADAGSDAAQDSGTDASADAAQDSGSDAGADAGVDAAQPPACGGE